MSDRIELGDVARDRVTGFEGVVVARTQWLTGCDRLTLQPQKKFTDDGTPVEALSFDEPVCELVKRGDIRRLTDDWPPPTTAIATTGDNTPTTLYGKTGGPRPEPTRRAAPTRR